MTNTDNGHPHSLNSSPLSDGLTADDSTQTQPQMVRRQIGIRQRSLRRCRLGRATELVFILATGLTLALTGQVQAQAWDGGGADADWNTPANWNPNGAPAAASSPTVSGAGGGNANPTISANTPGYTLTTISGGTVTANATLNSTSVVVSGTGTLNIDASAGGVTGNLTANAGGTVTNNGALTGNLTVSGGIVNNVGSVTGSTSVTSGTLRLLSGNLADSQSVNVSGTGTLTVDSADSVGAVTQSGGTIDGIRTLTTTTFGQTGGDLSGTLSSAGAKTLEGGTVSGTLQGAGATTVQTGSTTLTGTISGGATTITTGGTLAVNGGTVSDLTVAGGTLRGTATSSIFGSALTIGAGATGTISAATGTTFTIRPTEFTYGTSSTTVIGSATDTGRVRIDPITAWYFGEDSDVEVAGGTLVIASSGNGSLVLSNVGGLVGNREVTINSGATVDINGVNSGIANLTGAGTVTNGAAGAATVTLESDQNSTFSGVIQNGTGTVSVTKSLGGTLTLSGTNTYTGTTAVNSGTLEVTGQIAGNVTVNGSGRLRIGASTAIGGTITTTGSTVSYANGVTEGSALIISSATTDLEVLGTDAATQSGVISSTGAFGFEKIGTGQLTVSGANTYTGETVVSAGTLRVENATGLGTAAAGTSVSSGATLALNGGIAVTDEALALNGTGAGGNGALHSADGLNSWSGTVNLATASTIQVGLGLFLGGAVSGSDLTKTGAGTLQLTGSNSYGTTTISDGVVSVGGGGTTGTLGSGAVTNNSALALFRSDTFTVSNDISGSGTLSKFGIGTAILTGANSYAGTTTINAGTLQVGNGGTTGTLGSGAVTNNATLAFDRSDTVTQSGDISGSGALRQNGTGTLILTGTNSYAGTTTIETGGTLQVGNGGTTGTLGTGNTTNDGALVFNRSNALSYAGVISGGGTVTQSGSGTTTLTGANTYTGTTTVSAGGLTVTGAGAIASAAVNVTGGVLTTDSDALAAGTTVTISGAGTFTSSGTDSFTAITQTGGTVNGSGVLTLTGAFNQSGGGVTGNTVDINAASFTQNNGTIAAGTTVTSSGAQSLQGGTIAGNLDGAGAITALTGTTDITGTVTNAASFTQSSGTVNLTGTGSIDTAGNNVTVNGGTLNNDGNGLADNEVLTVNAPGAIVLTGADTVGGLAGSGTVTMTGATLTVNNAAAHAFSGALQGTGGFTKIGAGTLTLSGTNTHDGDTEVAGGTLVLSGGAAVEDNRRVVVTSPGTLQVDTAETVGSLNGSGNVVLNATVTSGLALQLTSLTGTVSGAGGLTLTTGQLELSGNNTYTGLTTVGAGSVVFAASNNALGAASAGTTVNSGGALRLSGGITTPEVLTLNGWGAAGNGALRSVAGSNTVTGAITIATASEIQTDTGTGLTLSGAMTNTGWVTFDTAAAATTTVSGNITGAGGLTKTGTGILTLSGANSYSGATALNAGTTNVNGSITSTATVAASATLNNNGSVAAVGNGGTFNANNGSTTGALTNTGTATATASAAVTTLASVTNDGGTTTLNGGAGLAQAVSVTGAIDVNAGTVSTTGTVLAGSVTNGATFNARGTLDADVTNEAAGTFNVTGALSGADLNAAGGANSFTNQGTLNVNNAYTGLASLGNTGTVNLASSLSTTGGTTNSNLFVITGGTVAGAFTNNGEADVMTTATFTGPVSGTGVIDMRATAGNQTVTFSGGAGSVGATSYRLNYSALGIGDTVVSTGGNAIGAGLQNFDIALAGEFAIGTEAVLVSGQTGLTPSSTFQLSGGTQGGALLYSIADSGANTVLRAEANPGMGGIMSGVALTQSIVGTVVNLPPSTFSAGLATKTGCSQGGYVRAGAGRADSKGTSTSGFGSRESELFTTYQGVQGGFGVFCNDGRFFDGWNGGIGAILGYNTGKSDQPVRLDLGGGGGLTTTSITRTDFNQNYGGLYFVANKGALTIDGQVRFEDTLYTLNEQVTAGFGGLGLSDDRFRTNSASMTSRLSYGFDLNDAGLTFAPTVGFAITRTGASTLNFSGSGNRMDLAAHVSRVGILGGTLAKTTFNEAAASWSTLFMSGNYYHEFSDNRLATFTVAGNSSTITSSNLGNFGELSLGLNYGKVLSAGPAGAQQLNANVRVDGRFGANISNSFSLTAQVQLTF